MLHNEIFLLAGAKHAALCVGWSQDQAQAQSPNTKLSITHSFFELQSPDFACMSKYQNVTAIHTQKEQKRKNAKRYSISAKHYLGCNIPCYPNRSESIKMQRIE